jgi:erythromycin esterase-like protein
MSFYIVLFFLYLSACKTKYIPAKPVAITKPLDSIFLNLPAHSLDSENDLDSFVNAIGDARIVLLGEGTHGTADFYKWRAAISRKLVTGKSFNAIAVEGDWADGEKVNRFICGDVGDSAGAVAVLKKFDRWPEWLWANTEVASFITWLNHYNQRLADSDKITFTGTDLFSVDDALGEMEQQSSDTALHHHIENFRKCFEPFSNNERSYGKDTTCTAQAASLLLFLRENSSAFPEPVRTKLLQGAATVVDAELYLRSITTKMGGWNIREQHMAETILRILHNKPGSKIIAWLHNSHAGVASFSGMRNYNRTSVGELLKTQLGDSSVFITGFGTYSGTVTASRTWGGVTETMGLAPAEPGSWDDILHNISNANKYILFRETRNNLPLQNRWVYMRSIGVVYTPYQRSGASQSIPAKRYDAFIFIDHSSALRPLEAGKTTQTDSGPTDDDDH